MKTPIHFSDDDGTVPIYFDADGEQCTANEVVRRCNAHDDLLAALKEAETAIDDCLRMRSHLHYKALDTVRAAVAKADG